MGPKRILLVEDDDAIRRVATLSLEQVGKYQVLALPGGAEAVARAAAFAPDLLLLDVSMPGMDGPQTLAALRQQPPLRAVPAVFLTAHTQARQVESLRALGAVDVIAKPFEPALLCERVAAALSQPVAVDPTKAQPTVLVVEDDPGIAYLLGFILKQQGSKAVMVADGLAAQEAIATGDVTDLVMLDIMLPGVDGMQLLKQITASPRWQAVPVMMLSAKGEERLVAQALADGASDFLVKPFDPIELAARLRKLLAAPGATSSPSSAS